MKGNKDILKFLRDAVLYLVTFIGVYILVIVLLAAVPPFTDKIPNLKNMRGKSDFSLLRFLDLNLDADVWVFGSSHAFRGFDPRIFASKGISIQNFGSASQHLLNSNRLLEEYLMQGHPKLVLVELDHGLMNYNASLEPTFVLMSNKYINSSIANMAKDVNHIGVWNSLAYHFVHQKIYPLEASVQNNISNDTYIRGGFVETDITINSNDVSIRTGQGHIELTDINFSFAKSIVDLCAKHDVVLMFYSSPKARYWTSGYSNINKVDAMFLEFSETQNVPFIGGLNDEEYLAIGLVDSTDFFDSNHLTQTGVNKYNDYLINILKNKWKLFKED
jgi:hypothetical protein